VEVVLHDYPCVELQAFLLLAEAKRLDENLAASCGDGKDRQPADDARSDKVGFLRRLSGVIAAAYSTQKPGMDGNEVSSRHCRSQTEFGNEQLKAATHRAWKRGMDGNQVSSWRCVPKALR
jgi:hypothetical protein